MKQLVLDLIPTPTPTFENFVPGRNVEALHLLACFRREATPGVGFGGTAFSDASKNMTKILYLWGEAGSGKTHLQQALANMGDTLFLVDRDLENDIAAASCYVIDNVQTLNDQQQIGLFNLINRVNLPAESARIVVAGNAAPRDLALRPELTSRLGSGLTFQLHPLSDSEKADALRAHAKTRGIRLRDEVIAYLLRHARRDMASLISILDALDIHSLETGREITLPLLREILQQPLSMD